jgi:threonine dehydrogenase-like Zn-dependent dehydrogenase
MFTRAGGFLPGRAVAVYGGGPIGLASVALAKAAGASKIFCFEPLDERRELSGKLGATHLINPLEEDGVAIVAEETKGDGVAMAVECTGNFPAVMGSIEGALGLGGKVVIVGLDPRPVELNLIEYQLKAASVYGTVGHSGSWDFPNVIKLMASGQIDMHHAITRRFPLEELVNAIDETKTRVDGKILVKSEI